MTEESKGSCVRRLIWQYWETRGTKPAFVDGLHEIAKRNSGCEVVLVTPETLDEYLPDLPREILQIEEMAHKADMIRAMLVARHGGMWLDSDAIVLRNLSWIFDLLEDYEFVGFNNQARLEESRPWVRVNCFASRPGGYIAREWSNRQHQKFPRVKYGWEEIGTEILHPLCLSRPELVKVLPFELICPVNWNQVDRFKQSRADDDEVFRGCVAVMLSNATLKKQARSLQRMSCQQIAEKHHLLGAIMRAALNGRPVDGPGRPTRHEQTGNRALWLRQLLGRIRKKFTP
jgi:hypothetical protein